MRKIVYVSLALSLAGCGGGGSDGSAPNPTINVTPTAVTNVTVSLTASATNPYQDDGFVLTWTSNAKSCTASGDWTGTITTSGNKSLSNPNTGSNTYAISCVDGDKSASTSVTITTQEKPYFLEVTNSFPDPTDHYWFFDKTRPANLYAGTVTATNSIDLNNDGKKEFVMVVYKGSGHDLNRGAYISDTCKTTTVVYEISVDKFVDASDKYLETNRDFSACVDANNTVVDINNDGRPDIFYSANQEDGRNPDLGSKMDSQLVGWVSQSNGKYKIYKFGDSKWYHSIGYGIDSSGRTFVTGAGYPNNNVVQNNRYVWSNNTLETINDGSLPNMSPQVFLFQSSGDKTSNLLIQQTWSTQMGVEGYVKQNMTWRKTNVIGLATKELREEVFTVWSGDTRKIKVLEFEGKPIAGTGGGSNLENICNLKLYKDKDSVALGIYTIAYINNYVPGAGVNEVKQISPQYLIVSLTIENNLLTYKSVTIKGENNFAPGKFQCMDVNKDGYDDIVLGLGNDKSIQSQRIYLNQKDGTFTKLDLGTKGVMSLLSTVNMYASHMDDYDNDGKMDVVIYPSNVTSNQSLQNGIKFYKGFKTIL